MHLGPLTNNGERRRDSLPSPLKVFLSLVKLCSLIRKRKPPLDSLHGLHLALFAPGLLPGKGSFPPSLAGPNGHLIASPLSPEPSPLRDVPDEVKWLICFNQSQGLLEQISRVTEQEKSLFIRLVLQGKSRISKSKREKYFREDSEETISEMEKAVNSCFAPLGQGFVNTDFF